jgi:hypothetical protein
MTNPNGDMAKIPSYRVDNAKRKAVGGKKKKGKSCSATCIAINKICLVDIPWVSANFIPKVVMTIKESEPRPKSKLPVRESGQKIEFSGANLRVNGEEFKPSNTLPGSTTPVLFRDKDGNGRWVVKGGGALGQNTAEKAANDVYNILSPKLGSGGVESNLVDGKLVNKFIDGGRTLNSLSSDQIRSLDIPSKIKKSHMADSLVANWDYVGLVNDNMMVDRKGNLVRIDSGGTFNFRAQGGDKKYGPLATEIWVLRGKQGKQFWANAGEGDFRDLWVTQTRAISSEAAKLKSAVNSSTLPRDVKKSFEGRVQSMEIANQVITGQRFGNKTIEQLADEGKISWKDVDSAMERAFNKSLSLDVNSSNWGQSVRGEIAKELGSLVKRG